MADTMALPDFRFVRLREHHKLAVGKDHILDVELIPAGAQVGMQSFTMNAFSLEAHYAIDAGTQKQTAGLSAQNYGYVYVTCWYMPFFDTDAFTLPTNWATFRTMLNARVDKVETAAPTTALIGTPEAAGSTQGEGDNPDGSSSEDTNLLFRPDRIQQRAITTNQMTMPATLLFKRLVRLGLFYDGAWRTGSNESVQYLASFGGTVMNTFATALPGVVMWVLTIPPDAAADAEFKSKAVNPGNDNEFDMTDADAGKKDYLASWDAYKFLAPRRNPITGQLEVTSDLTVVNNFRKLSLIRRAHYNLGGETDPTPYYKQVPLNVILERDIIFRRNAGVNSFVSPAG